MIYDQKVQKCRCKSNYRRHCYLHRCFLADKNLNTHYLVDFPCSLNVSLYIQTYVVTIPTIPANYEQILINKFDLVDRKMSIIQLSNLKFAQSNTIVQQIFLLKDFI